jgi:hypothetical protein
MRAELALIAHLEQAWGRKLVRRDSSVRIKLAPVQTASLGHFSDIFESDWETAQQKIPSVGKKQAIGPEAVAKGNFVEVRAADYQEV